MKDLQFRRTPAPDPPDPAPATGYPGLDQRAEPSKMPDFAQTLEFVERMQARADAKVPDPARPKPPLPARLRHLVTVFSGLLLGFLCFKALADWTAYTTGEMQPGQIVFSNTMTQLFTAGYRLAFIQIVALALIRLLWPELWAYFRPDQRSGPDMDTTLRYEITPFQRLCVFLFVFSLHCLLFVLLLQVSLPASVSVGP